MHALLSPRARRDTRWIAAAAGTAAVLAACALVVRRQTLRAERDFPPRGRFVTVDGVRLHFTVHGRDEAAQTVVLLHGEGSMGEDFDISGLVAQAAERYRVVVFDRPGHGHSERPCDRRWGPLEQADLIHAALARMRVVDPIVLGHSWGALVALSMGLRYPRDVGSLVLASGCYFPSLRLDLLWRVLSALPGIGALLCHTVAPLIARLLWPASVKRLFAPGSATPQWRERYPVGLALRPSQLHAGAAECASLLPVAVALQRHYGDLDVPAVLVAGASDRQFSTRWHSMRLHRRLERVWLRIVEGRGHMVHHVAPGQVMAAIDQAAAIVWHHSLMWRAPAGLRSEWEPEVGQAPLPVVPCTARHL